MIENTVTKALNSLGYGKTANSEAIRIEGETALRAIATDTPEGDIQASTQRAAWVRQITHLEGLLDDRSRGLRPDQRLDYELMLRQLRRNVRALDRAEGVKITPETHATQRLASFGAVGRPRRFLGAVPVMAAGFRPWMAWAGIIALLGSWGVLQTGRLAMAHAELQEREAELVATERHLAEAQNLNQELQQRASAADAQSAATAETLRLLEAQRRRENERRRRDQREIQDITSGVGDPPDFGLRNDPSTTPTDSDGR